MNYFNIEVTPILTLSLNNSLCNIISLDGVTMMIDCGWNETFTDDISLIYLDKINFKIDYVFLSNNNINNFGGLPFLLKNHKIDSAKIYATTPIAKLGFNILLDAYISKIETSENFTLITDSDISSSFLSMNEVKFKENIKLPHKNSEIVITPLPSGNSLGGCCWKINYKLQSIVYAPQFSLNLKYICDPFPYESLKNINLLITDSKMCSKIPVVKTVIENEFKKNIMEEMERGRNIFIPTDTANLNMEILIHLEKILDEFYANKTKDNNINIIKERDGLGRDLPYKVVVSGYSSNEIVDSIKSLIEFLGSSISQQFYSYNENPFNLQYVHCIKDVKEYHEVKKNFNLIILSSFESLDGGLSYKLIPEILPDPNYRIFLISKSHKFSMIRKILKKVKDGIKVLDYEEIKRIVIDYNAETNKKVNVNVNMNMNIVKNNFISFNPNNNINTSVNPSNNISNTNIINHIFPQKPIESLNLINKLSDLSIKKKLFAKSPYPMFSYHQKKKLNEYGIELKEKEIKLMKSASEDKAEVFESSFKTFLYTNNKSNESLKNEMRLKIKRQDLFSKAHYERTKRIIPIGAKFSFYDLFDSTGIDMLSKEIIIKEINPKEEVIFLGAVVTCKQEFNKMMSKLEGEKIKCKVINNYQTETIIIRDNMLNVKFDGTILNTLPSFFIKDYGFVYDMNNIFLKIKSKRGEIKDICIADPIEVKEGGYNIKKENVLRIGDREDFLDSFYTKSDLKLINLKREISKLVNEEFYIKKNYITNIEEDFKLYLRQNELVLEGNLNATYLKLRNCIYSNFINLDEL